MGWNHPDGKALETAKKGDRVSGTVTNVLHGRFWINVGFVQDATFKADPGRFAVGDEIVGLEVESLNRKRSRVEIKLTPDTRLKHRDPAEREKRAKKAQGGSSNISTGTKKAISAQNFSK